MTDFNSAKHRVVWFDIPVAGLDRATAFYRAVPGSTTPSRESSRAVACASRCTRSARTAFARS